jgi:hypothetical protein
MTTKKTLLGTAIVLAILSTSLDAYGASLGPSNAQRVDVATVAANHLQRIAPLPTGTKRLSSAPAAYAKLFSQPSGVSADLDKVDVSRLYEAPSGRAAFAWINRQKVDGLARSGWGSSSGPGSENAVTVGFSPPSTVAYLIASINYTAVITPSNSLVFRIDTVEQWTPQKSKFSQIPSGATSVLIKVNPGQNTTATAESATVVNATTIAAIISKIDALPATSPGVLYCPADFGASITLKFFKTGSTSAYATVVAQSGGCGNVSIRQRSASGALLGTANVAGGATLSTYLKPIIAALQTSTTTTTS